MNETKNLIPSTEGRYWVNEVGFINWHGHLQIETEPFCIFFRKHIILVFGI
jgi:hypothetical protein